MNWDRMCFDAQYIFLNRFVNKIPSWAIRRLIYVKCGMHLHENARIGIGTVVICPHNISIGERSVINENCFLDGRGGLKIGRDTSISAYTKILSASHRSNGKNFQYYTRKTIIGKHVWIGLGAVILDGSKVEDDTIIGAGAVLKGCTSKKDIMVGNPAKCIKKREMHNDYHLEYKAFFR